MKFLSENLDCLFIYLFIYYLFIYKLYHVLPVKNEIDIFSFISRILGCRLYFQRALKIGVHSLQVFEIRESGFD